MRIRVDLDKCTGNGMCESIADDVFEVTDEASVRLLMEHPPDDRREEMEEAVEQCPTEAISIED